MTSSVLITGASGFLGRVVVDEAVRSGWRVRATSRRAVTVPGVQWIEHDLTHAAGIEPLVDGIDAIIHVAGLAHQFGEVSADSFVRLNVEATARLAAGARSRVRNFVLISSSSVYGPDAGIADENSKCAPVTPYGESKLAAERAALAALEQSESPLTILRLVTLYGAGDPGNVLRLVRAIDRRRFLWVGRGSNRKSLLHVSDAARAVILALKQGDRTPRLFNVVGSTPSMHEIVGQISQQLGREIPAVHIPGGVALDTLAVAAKVLPAPRLRRMHDTLSKWLADEACDGGAFETRFGFRPRVSLSDGLREEVAWYRDTLTKA